MSVSYESDTLQTLDDIADIFSDIDPNNPPTMRDALEDLNVPEDVIKETVSEMEYFIQDRTKKKLLPKKLPASHDELNAIYCYSKGELDVDGVYNMFELVNKALYTKDNKKEAVRPYRKYIYLLLSGLRKLPRTVPDDNIIYRALKTYVTTEDGGENVPYAVDRVKTWWGFTSTSVQDNAALHFLKDRKGKNFGTGTMFTIRGRIWGYDISDYAFFGKERELLVEPERKMKIVNVSENKGVIFVDVEMLESEIPLAKLIPPKDVELKPPKELPTKSSLAVPKNFWAESVWWNGAKLMWDSTGIQGEVYQIGLQGKFFFSGAKPILKQEKTFCELKDLEAQKEYKLCIRAGDGDAWSNWKGPLSFETPALNPPERLLVKNTAYNELEITWDEVPSAPFIRTSYRVEAVAADGSKKIAYEGTERRFRQGLEEKQVFKFRVQAGVEPHWSKWSQEVQGKWENIPVPSNVSANVEGGKACIVSWDKVSGRNITYQVGICVNGNTDLVLGDPTKETHYEYDAEADITSLAVKVRALKDGVAGKWSDTVTV